MLFEKIQLEEGETVLKVVRKHWFVIFTELFGIALVLFIPVFIWFFFSLLPAELSLAIEPAKYVPELLFLAASWFLLSLMAGFAVWTNYYLDLWVVTDRRIIVVDQIHFFNRKVSSFRLERLQDIKVSVVGILQTLLNFGTLRAQTAGAAESNFKTTDLPDPRGLQSLIQRAMDARLKTIYRDRETTTPSFDE
jgi:uncharacterized membrane protein YczE